MNISRLPNFSVLINYTLLIGLDFDNGVNGVEMFFRDGSNRFYLSIDVKRFQNAYISILFQRFFNYILKLHYLRNTCVFHLFYCNNYLDIHFGMFLFSCCRDKTTKKKPPVYLAGRTACRYKNTRIAVGARSSTRNARTRHTRHLFEEKEKKIR